jgi:hypothetical protein
MDVWTRNLRVWLPKVWLWPPARNTAGNEDSTHCTKSQLGQGPSRPSETSKRITLGRKSQLHRRRCLHRDTPLTP